MLSIQGFKKYYDNVLILEIPTLDLQKGTYWIKGENGSGKSSFFRSIAGMIPCKGDIRFDDGIELHKNPVEYRQRINYSEAEPLFPHFLTAKDIIHFVAKAKGAHKEQVTSIVNHFGVNEYFNKPTGTFSSGMLKKLSLVLGFIGDPQLIILDEPFITLDEHARKKLVELIIQGVERQKTILISSHQTAELTNLAITKTYCIENKTAHEI